MISNYKQISSFVLQHTKESGVIQAQFSKAACQGKLRPTAVEVNLVTSVVHLLTHFLLLRNAGLISQSEGETSWQFMNPLLLWARLELN